MTFEERLASAVREAASTSSCRTYVSRIAPVGLSTRSADARVSRSFQIVCWSLAWPALRRSERVIDVPMELVLLP